MADDAGCAVYVGGLSLSTDEESLKQHFSTIGDIKATKVVYDKDTGENRRFGFVTFTSNQSALEAIREMDGKALDGRILRVSTTKKKEFERPNRDFPPRAAFRERERRLSRRSPPPYHQTRKGSPFQRRSLSPRGRSVERSPSQSLQKQNRAPESREEQESESPARRSKNFRDDPEQSENVNDERALKKLRGEIEKQRGEKHNLGEQIKSLISAIQQSRSAEESLLLKTRNLESSLKAIEHAHSQQTSVLEKFIQSVVRLRSAEKARKISERDLRQLVAAGSSVETETKEEEL